MTRSARLDMTIDSGIDAWPVATPRNYMQRLSCAPHIGVGTKFSLGGPLGVMPSVGLHHCYTQHMHMHIKLVTCACWYSMVLVVNVRAMCSY